MVPSSAARTAPVSAPQFAPIFVKGHVKVTIGKQTLEFVHQNVSAFGVTGLPWGDLDPQEYFGARVSAQITLLAAGGMRFHTQATILRESTAVAEHFGLKFIPDAELKHQLAEFVSKNGVYPTEYLRKYPRIPAAREITTFPVHASVRREGKMQSFALDIRNLSPNGMLLSTENAMALRITPGERLDLTLDPRGWFPFQITLQVLVCRVTDEKLPETHNTLRYLGLRILRIDEPHRTAFLDLLRDILVQLQRR